MWAVLLERARTSLELRARDARDRLSGRTDALVPPRRLDFVGHSDFVATGDEFLDHLRTYAGLQPGSRILDAGCGIGRMARPLTRFLADEGAYAGFDPNAAGIAWCRERYARFANFTFTRADLFNARYHPEGTQSASEFRFPAEDASFDVVLMASVLTHLLPEECEHYVAESERVLRPGGRLLATFFVLDDESRGLIADDRSGLAFPDAQEAVAVIDEAVPEEAVAYGADWIGEVLAAHGLTHRGTHPGSWCGRAEHVSFQDLVVAERAA